LGNFIVPLDFVPDKRITGIQEELDGSRVIRDTISGEPIGTIQEDAESV
jgi:hypothetical protein